MGDINKDLTISAETEGFPQAATEVAGLGTAVEAATTSTKALDATASATEETFDQFRARLHAAAEATLATGTAAEATATKVGLLTRAITFLMSPLGLLVTALVLILTHIKELGEMFLHVGESVDKFVNGVGAGTPVLDAHGKVIDELSPKYNAAATAQDKLALAQRAMAAGVIPHTNDVKMMVAEYDVWLASLRKTADLTPEMAAAFRKMGIDVTGSIDSVKATGDALAARFDVILRTQSPAAALEFANANKREFEKVQKTYFDLGEAVPPQIDKITHYLGIWSTAEIEAAKDKGLADRMERDLKRMGDDSVALLKKVGDLGDEYLKTRDKIERSTAAEIDAVEKRTAKTVADLQKEVEETTKAHDLRQISDTEYNTKINQLFLAQSQARNASFDEEKAIHDKEKVELDKNAEDHKKAMEKASDAYVDLQDKIKESAEKLASMKDKMGAQDELTKSLASSTNILSTSFGTTGTSAEGLGVIVSGLSAKFDELAASARAAAAAVASVPTGGGGYYGSEGA